MLPDCGFDSLGWFNLASRLGPCCQPKGSRGGGGGGWRGGGDRKVEVGDFSVHNFI